MRIRGNIQYIFLPAAGLVSQTWFNSYGSKGYYWTGTGAGGELAWFMGFDPNYGINDMETTWYLRSWGFSVRPVRLVEEPQ